MSTLATMQQDPFKSPTTIITESTIKDLTTVFSKYQLVKKSPVRKKQQIIRQLILNALLNCIRVHFKKPTITYETEFEDLTTIKIKTLTMFFSRHKLYVTASPRKKKKVLRQLILNALLNCIRKHFKKPTVAYSDEFKDVIVTTARQYIPDLRDPCWSSKQLLRDLGYNVFVSESHLAQSMQKIKQNLRYRSSSSSSSSGSSKINDKHLTEAITAVVNNVYPDETVGYNSLLEQVMFEIEKRQPVQEKKSEIPMIQLPSEIDAFVFAKYIMDVKNHTDLGVTVYTQLAIARLVLNKHNKKTLPDSDKILADYIPADVNKKLMTKTNSAVKKRINELKKAAII